MKASYKVSPYYNRWTCAFLVDGRYNHDAHGTDGTGVKLYDTEEKAIAAGKRYVKKMLKLGFTA